MQEDGVIATPAASPESLSQDADANRGRRTERGRSEPAQLPGEENSPTRHHYRRRSRSSCETTRATAGSNAGDSHPTTATGSEHGNVFASEPIPISPFYTTGTTQDDANRRPSRRRTGPLSNLQRERAALIRKLGACSDCRRRRVACHPSHHNLTWEEAFRKFKGEDGLSRLPSPGASTPAAAKALDLPRAPQLPVKSHGVLAQSPTHPDPDTEIGGLDTSSGPLPRPQPFGFPFVKPRFVNPIPKPHFAYPGNFLKSRPDLEPSLGNKEHEPAGSDIGSVPLTDTHTTHGLSIDSGYGTASVTASQRGAVGTRDGKSKLSTSIAVEECDGRTVYSDEGSIAGAELDTYKAELVDNLVNRVRQLQPDPETLESIFEAMPMLMKAFALRLGQPGSTKTQRDVMYFVHKYRNDLSKRFKHSMLGLVEEDTAPHREPHPVDDEVRSSRISEWLVGLNATEPDEAVVAREQQSGTAPPEEDEISLPDKHGYRQVIFDSPAYKTLISRLERQVKLTLLAETDAMVIFRQTILQALAKRQYINRHTESQTFTMLISAAWDPVAFLSEQYEGSNTPGELLERVITLTGSMGDAQALPCSEYLSQTWPTTGPHILTAIAKSLNTGRDASVTLPDRSRINVACGARTPGQFYVLAEGTADSIAEVTEIVAWLTAALRCSPNQSIMASCTPRVEIVMNYLVKIEFDISTDDVTEGGVGRCWHGMFRNPVVVRGFPIPRRPRPNTGLEIPLHMAACMTDTRRLHQFMGQYFLKGFSAMLAAVEVVGGIVLWHLYYNPAGGRISYCDADESPYLEGINENVLRESRHIIGWCSQADYLAGDTSANYDIRSSRLPIPGREFALEKVSFSVGQIVTGGCQFSIGKKDAPVNISKQDYGYLAKLQWIEQRYVVLWDEEDKCGWLVKGTSALLHLLHASLEHCRKDKFSSEFLLKEGAFQEPSVRFHNNSAIEALINANNRALRLYKQTGKSFEEIVEWADGRQETVTKTRTSYTTVEDRVMELFESLEKLIDYEAHGKAAAKGVNMKPQIRSHLQGWDFRDIATNRDPLYLRVATPPSSGRTWVDFVASIRAVTLLGRGFGQLIKPACPQSGGSRPVLWRTMPTGKGFLGACTADLKEIIDNEGDWTTTPLTLAGGVIWHNPCQHSPFADDAGVKLEIRNPVQELLPASSSFRGLLLQIKVSGIVDVDSCEHGAVIFGRSESSGFTWPDMGDPTPIDSIAAPLTTTTKDSEMLGVEASSDGSSSTTRMEGSDSQDTPMTSPVGSISPTRSGQASTLSGLCGIPVSISSSQTNLEEDPHHSTGGESSASGPLQGLGIGRRGKKRAKSEMEGSETTQTGISKKFKAFSLTAGFHRGGQGGTA